MTSGYGQEAGAIHIVQLTDPHLYADPAGTLLGMNTRDSFLDCLAQAMRRHADHDLVLLTGDLVHDESDTAYEWLCEQLQKNANRVAILPGNHDNPVTLFRHFANDATVHGQRLILERWQLVLLDTHLDGSEAGRLGDRQLQFLEHCLADHERWTLVCMHHPPVATGSAWLDTMQLQNADAFWHIIDNNPRVTGILFGHIHQAMDTLHKGCRLLGTPSTCIQFLPGSERFAIDPQPPGYRWLALLPDGNIHTAIERLPAVPPGLDLRQEGY